MKQNKYIKIIVSILALILIQMLNIKVYAANLNLNIDFNGKEIEMASETPEMKWELKNIAPGKSNSTTIIINSIGNKEVKAEFATEITDGKEYEEYLNMKITNSKNNETIYEGKYKEFTKVAEKISAKETKSYNVIVTLPEGTENKFANTGCTIKFNFTAKGEKNSIAVANQQEQQEQMQTQQNTVEVEEVTTNTIKQIKISQSYIIFIVLGILVVVLAVLIILFIRTRKSPQKSTQTY